MTLKPFEFSKQFLEDRCERCGECLEKCPVLKLPLDQAQAEIRALVEGEESCVVARCTGCMACNSLCPNGANPHALILSRWQDRIRERGLPMRAGLVLPYQEPNLHTIVLQQLPADEKALVEQWEANWRHPPGLDTMMYVGCNGLLQPFLLDSALFEGLAMFGSAELCCGEPFYRMGYWEAAEAAAKHVKAEFDRMGFKRLVVPCLGGYYLFKHVYEDVFDAPLGCDIVFVADWLLDRIKQGELEVTPLNLTAVLHDNCWPKASGDRMFDRVRALLDMLGIAVVEPPHTRETALCCGMCACAARFSLLDVLRASKRRLKELEAVKADMVIDYCGGCNWLFAVTDGLSFRRISKPIYHLLEVVQMSAGETPKHRTRERAATVVRSMRARLARSYLTRKRFWVEGISGGIG